MTDTVFIARVIDHSDFGRVCKSAAFERKCDAQAWLDQYAVPSAQAHDPEWVSSIVGDIESFDFVPAGKVDQYATAYSG